MSGKKLVLEVEKTPILEVELPPTRKELLKKLEALGDDVLVIDQVSKRFYPKEQDFITDAEKTGFVSRALPPKPGIFRILHKGKKVFTTRFVRGQSGEYHRLFGYYEVTGLATNLPDELFEEVKKKFNNFIKEIEVGKKQVIRGCGTYEIKSIISVEDMSLEEVASAIYSVAKERGFDSLKFLVVGKFHKLPISATLKGMPSLRTITRVPIPESEFLSKLKTGLKKSIINAVEVVHISNYQLGKNDPRQKSLLDFMG